MSSSGRCFPVAPPPGTLENPGYVKYRPGGEPHATNPEVVVRCTDVGRARTPRAVNGGGGRGVPALRRARQRVALRSSCATCSSSSSTGPPCRSTRSRRRDRSCAASRAAAMSHGALSAEAHETVAIALNCLGARAQQRRGRRGSRARSGSERNSAIKQVASGRFGVTPEYLAHADELQIKIAQGSKPGEGGQLPGAQGDRRDRAPSAHAARSGADLAAAPSRHLLDRRSRPAHLRPATVQPACRRLGQAGRVGRRRASSPQAASRRERTSSTSPGRRRNRRQPALLDQERGRSVGARPRRDAADARLRRTPWPCAPPRRRWTEDGAGRRRRGAPRR